MTKKPAKRRKDGRFLRGRSGNPSGRPKGTTNHQMELRRAEEQALELACNVCDEVKEAAREALTEANLQKVVPLIQAITEAAKAAAQEGEIGPSTVALLRNWYESHREDESGEFFAYVGLPRDCTWDAFRVHYTTRKRVDNDRHAKDLFAFPPIAERVKELAA